MNTTITRADVEALKQEAAQAGDEAMIEICDLALSKNRQQFNRGDSRIGDEESHAWRRCLNAIEYARGQEMR